MKRSSIIWGVIFILIGLLILLRSFDIIQFSFWSFWKLWPVILILIGISLIPIKDWLKTTLSIIIIVCSFIFVISAYNTEDNFFSNYKKNWKEIINTEIKNNITSNYSASFSDSVSLVKLDIEIPISKNFSAESYNQEGILFETVGAAAFNLSTNTTDYVANSSLTPVFSAGSGIEQANIFLSKTLNYSINIQSKSKKNKLDFSNINITELNLTAADNNKSWEIIFSDKYSPVKVNLLTNNNVKDITLTIPETIGIKFSASDIDELNNWNELKRSGDYFVSDNYETAAVKIEIAADQVKNSKYTFIRF